MIFISKNLGYLTSLCISDRRHMIFTFPGWPIKVIKSHLFHYKLFFSLLPIYKKNVIWLYLNLELLRLCYWNYECQWNQMVFPVLGNYHVWFYITLLQCYFVNYKEQVWNDKELEKGRREKTAQLACNQAWKKREKSGKWLPVAVCIALIVPFNVVSIF